MLKYQLQPSLIMLLLFCEVTWMIFLVIMAIVLLIILVVLIFLRKRVKIAIELIEEASIAVGHMMSTLFFPLVPFIWQFLIIVWFVLVAIFLASSGVAEYKIDLNGQEDCKLILSKLIGSILYTNAMAIISA